MSSFNIVDDWRDTEVPVRIQGDRVYMPAEAARSAIAGFDSEAPGDVELGEVAQRVGRPLAVDLAERVAWIGASAEHRARALAALEAPDFVLADLEGRPHRLADHRGRKVLLVVWASW